MAIADTLLAAHGPRRRYVTRIGHRVLPEIADLSSFRRLRRDPDAQRPTFVALAQRHGLPPGELAPFTEGTHLVWGTRDAVLKLFVPLWQRDALVEIAMLERLSGAALPVPRLRAVGELNGLRYVVMSRLPGARIGDVCRRAGPDTRQDLARQCGGLMAELHALSPPRLPVPPLDQDTLLADRLSRVLDEQRARGAGAQLLDELEAFLDALDPLPPAEPVLLHADLTADHFLVEDGRITGLIDFADAFVGPWTYELAAPATSVFYGDPGAQQALLRGLGRSVDPRTVRTWIALHRYANLAEILDGRSLVGCLEALWAGG